MNILPDSVLLSLFMSSNILPDSVILSLFISSEYTARLCFIESVHEQ